MTRAKGYSKATSAALRRYGRYACLRALWLHEHDGYGARSIAQQFSLAGIRTTQQADAAINAGREIEARERGTLAAPLNWGAGS
jgi:hypothetical protein